MMYLTQGLFLGFYAASMPGPFQAFLLSQTLRNGWRRSLPLALIPLLSDGPIMLTFILVLSQLPAWFTSALQIIGGLFILYLAWDAFLAARKIEKSDPNTSVSAPNNLSFLKCATMNLLNPNVYIFWGTIGVPTILAGWKISPVWGIAFVLGFYGLMIPTLVGWIALFGTLGQLKPKIQTIITRLIALILVVVAINMLFTGTTTLLPLLR